MLKTIYKQKKLNALIWDKAISLNRLFLSGNICMIYIFKTIVQCSQRLMDNYPKNYLTKKCLFCSSLLHSMNNNIIPLF